MKNLLRQIGINTLAMIIIVGVLGVTYAAFSSVNPGDTLTATAWNEIVSKITNTNTNSTDLVTKSYVDSAVNAGGTSGGLDWRDCHTASTTLNGYSNHGTTDNLSCNAGYALVDSVCHGYNNDSYGSTQFCKLTSSNTLSVSANKIGTTQYRNVINGSIKCCKINL